MSHPAPAEPSQIVSLRLTPEQVRSLAPILARQRGRKEGALLSVTSFSYEPVAGGAVVKLDVAWLPWKLAQKVCRLIREASPRDGSGHSIRSTQTPL
jgi:hypothetical protein